MAAEVRRIRPDEGPRLRALRLRALADAPTAFGSTLAREEAFTDDVWRDRAAGGASGKPLLVGMFVEGVERSRGIGVALVEAVVAWARAHGATRLYLWVTATNDPAVALYDKCGFRPTGEQKPLGHSPSLAEIRMVRALR